MVAVSLIITFSHGDNLPILLPLTKKPALAAGFGMTHKGLEPLTN
jgi:hypothetical protein